MFRLIRLNKLKNKACQLETNTSLLEKENSQSPLQHIFNAVKKIKHKPKNNKDDKSKSSLSEKR